jgi:hypothetical protein
MGQGTRLWKGDQTDYGLSLKTNEKALLKVRITTYLGLALRSITIRILYY